MSWAQALSVEQVIAASVWDVSFLLAAAKGKTVSFEILAADDRVDADAKDFEDQSVVELANMSGRGIIANQVKQLMQGRKHTPIVDAGKLAILWRCRHNSTSQEDP